MATKLERFLNKIGIISTQGADWPVGDDNFIKFMSDGGVTDEIQADEFEHWLKAKQFKYTRDGRRFNIDDAADQYLIKIWPK